MGSWPEVDLQEVRRAFKGQREVYEEIVAWVDRGWRVRGQGHKYGLYPPAPDPGVRLVPPFVRVDATAKGDAAWRAKIIRRDCRAMEARIRDA
jgi:hypothetical protein